MSTDVHRLHPELRKHVVKEMTLQEAVRKVGEMQSDTVRMGRLGLEAMKKPNYRQIEAHLTGGAGPWKSISRTAKCLASLFGWARPAVYVVDANDLTPAPLPVGALPKLPNAYPEVSTPIRPDDGAKTEPGRTTADVASPVASGRDDQRQSVPGTSSAGPVSGAGNATPEPFPSDATATPPPEPTNLPGSGSQQDLTGSNDTRDRPAPPTTPKLTRPAEWDGATKVTTSLAPRGRAVAIGGSLAAAVTIATLLWGQASNVTNTAPTPGRAVDFRLRIWPGTTFVVQRSEWFEKGERPFATKVTQGTYQAYVVNPSDGRRPADTIIWETERFYTDITGKPRESRIPRKGSCIWSAETPQETGDGCWAAVPPTMKKTLIRVGEAQGGRETFPGFSQLRWKGLFDDQSRKIKFIHPSADPPGLGLLPAALAASLGPAWRGKFALPVPLAKWKLDEAYCDEDGKGMPRYWLLILRLQDDARGPEQTSYKLEITFTMSPQVQLEKQ